MRRVRSHEGKYVKIQASVRAYRAVEIANFAGFNQAGAPVMVRGSIQMPTRDGNTAAARRRPAAVNGASACHNRATAVFIDEFFIDDFVGAEFFICSIATSLNVVIVNIR
jgi:hypothetical protein